MKNCIVAGSGSGIGKSLLEEIANGHKDWNVFGLSRRGENWNYPLISGKNYKCDLTDENQFKELLNKNQYQLQKIDAVYFTLGDGLFKPIEEITNEEWDSHFALNLKSLFYFAKAIKNNLSPGSFLCFLSSTAGKVGFPESTAYCASKHAVAGFAKALREEWKENKIRIFTIYPGAIYTEIWESRDGFQKEDMIDVSEFAKYLGSFLNLHPSINIEDSYVLPPKGIL